MSDTPMPDPTRPAATGAEDAQAPPSSVPTQAITEGAPTQAMPAGPEQPGVSAGADGEAASSFEAPTPYVRPYPTAPTAAYPMQPPSPGYPTAAYPAAGYPAPPSAYPTYGIPPISAAPPPTQNVSAIVLTVLSGMLALSCYFTVAGLPALILGIVALSKHSSDPAAASRLTRIGWIVFAVLSILVLIGWGAVVALMVWGGPASNPNYPY